MKNKLILSLILVTATLSLTLTTKAMALSNLISIRPASDFNPYANVLFAYGKSTLGGVSTAYAGFNYRSIEFCDDQVSRPLIEVMELNPAVLFSTTAPKRYLVGGAGLCSSSATSLITDRFSLYYIRTGSGNRTVVERVNRLSSVPVTPSLEVNEAATSLTQNGNSLYWTVGNLLRMQPKRENLNIGVIPQTLYQAPTGSTLTIIAQDATHLFYKEESIYRDRELLRKISLNGGASTTLYTLNKQLWSGSWINSVAVDTQKIYWVEISPQTINGITRYPQLVRSAAKADGSNRRTLYSGTQNSISGLTSTSNKLYWTELTYTGSGTSSNGILRSIIDPTTAGSGVAYAVSTETAAIGGFYGLYPTTDTYWSGSQLVTRDRIYMTYWSDQRLRVIRGNR